MKKQHLLPLFFFTFSVGAAAQMVPGSIRLRLGKQAQNDAYLRV
jgi:hypothetical protein